MIATVKPELAVAVGVYVPATIGETGEVEVRVIVCEAADLVTVTVYVAVVVPSCAVTKTEIVFDPTPSVNDPEALAEVTDA